MKKDEEINKETHFLKPGLKEINYKKERNVRIYKIHIQKDSQNENKKNIIIKKKEMKTGYSERKKNTVKE